MYFFQDELRKTNPSVSNLSILNRNLPSVGFFDRIPARLQYTSLLLEEFNRRVPQSKEASKKGNEFFAKLTGNNCLSLNCIEELQRRLSSKKSGDSAVVFVKVCIIFIML